MKSLCILTEIFTRLMVFTSSPTRKRQGKQLLIIQQKQQTNSTNAAQTELHLLKLHRLKQDLYAATLVRLLQLFQKLHCHFHEALLVQSFPFLSRHSHISTITRTNFYRILVEKETTDTRLYITSKSHSPNKLGSLWSAQIYASTINVSELSCKKQLKSLVSQINTLQMDS